MPKKKSRRRAPVGREEIYKLVPLRKAQRGSGADLEPADPYYVQGRLEDHVIVSVSPTMSGKSAEDLRTKVMDEFERPVILVTHNIEFLKVYLIAGKEAREVRDRLSPRTDKPHLQPVADTGDQETSDDAALGDEDGTDGLGDRSGVRENGDSDTGEGDQGVPPGGPDGTDSQH